MCVGLHHEFDLIGYQLDKLCISTNHLIYVKLFLNYIICLVNKEINLVTG